jgi:hypothetical protein
MRHLKIEVIGHRTISQPYYNIITSGSTVFPDQQVNAEPLLRIEIDKKTWDAMFDLYEAHLRGFLSPTVQDAWDQYLMTLHLCGEQNYAGHKQIK